MAENPHSEDRQSWSPSGCSPALAMKLKFQLNATRQLSTPAADTMTVSWFLILCVPRIPSMALTSRVAIPAV